MFCKCWQDDGNSTEPVNIAAKVDAWVKMALQQATSFDGNDIIITMGGDFEWINAFIMFKNLDKLIHHVNRDGRINLMYSTPGMYASAKAGYKQKWPLQEGDMFPYTDCPACYWSGGAPAVLTIHKFAQLASFVGPPQTLSLPGQHKLI